MALLRWLIQRPILVWSAGLVTVAAGLWAYRTMPVDILPDLNYPLVNVVTQIPGASPEDVEQLVTRPIENALKGSSNLVRLSSVTTPGMSRITAAFSWGDRCVGRPTGRVHAAGPSSSQSPSRHRATYGKPGDFAA